MTWNAIITLIMLVAIVVLLFKNVANTGVIMTGVPIIAALIMGFSFADINGFIGSGLNSVSGTLFLMVMAVLFFGILQEAGVFDAIIKFIINHLGNNVLGTLLITAVIGMATQLSGSGATCALCTIPTVRPLYEKQNIRREALLLIETLASGVICLMPWAPGINEASAYVDLDVYDVFLRIRPLVIFSILAVFALCFIVAAFEKKNGAGMTDEEFQKVKAEINKPLEFKMGKTMAIVDGLAALLIIICLLGGWLKSNVAFALGFVVLLFLNYRTAKDKGEYLKMKAGMCFNLAFTMLGVACIVGINNGAGGLSDLSNLIANSGFSGIIPHLPFILCLLSMPLSITISGSKNSVVVPAVVAMVAGYGMGALDVMPAVFACGVISANLNLYNASPYLALGLAGVEMKDHLKYSLVPVYVFSLVMIAFMAVTGVVSI